MSTHLFGIRHHGPGCARSLRAALEALEPDIVLVEGPPDAEEVLPLLRHEAMTPPVALLVYAPDDAEPARSTIRSPTSRRSGRRCDYALQAQACPCASSTCRRRSSSRASRRQPEQPEEAPAEPMAATRR